MDVPCVGAACVDASGRLLLIQRGQPPAQGQWSLPGGRIEPGESAEQAVVREVREETGLNVRVVRWIGRIERDAPNANRYVIDDYLVELVGEATLQAGDDAANAGFFTVDELHALRLTEGLLNLLDQWGVWPKPSAHRH